MLAGTRNLAVLPAPYAILNCQARPARRGRAQAGQLQAGEDIVAVGATHLRLLAVTAAACMVVMTVSCSSAVTKPAASGSNEPPQKPEFTQVTSSMFVDRSAVPNSAAMEFTAPSISSDIGSNDPVDPPECAPIFWGPAPTQAGTVTWSTTRSPGPSTNLKVFNLFLSVPAERPDLRSLLAKCGTIKFRGVTTTASALPLPGLPSWSVATRITTTIGVDGAGIIGLCRGLYVSVAFTQKPGGDISPNDTNTLVKLFNDQVAKLQAM